MNAIAPKIRIIRELVLNANPTATKVRFAVRNHWVGLSELAATIVEDNSPVTTTIVEGHPMRNFQESQGGVSFAKFSWQLNVVKIKSNKR
ncbi:hypothetical protein N7451_011797 [Penicillium sp. IBT 35674x]|nr:hypothetical protein N7451_011797 [Penicillium sp. IBT 35674x]